MERNTGNRVRNAADLTIRKDSGAAMNTSKEGIMNNVKQGVLSVLSIFISISLSSLAQTFEATPSSSPTILGHSPSLAYESVLVHPKMIAPLSGDAIHDGGTNSRNVRILRVEDLNMVSSRSNIFLGADQVSFVVSAQTSAANRGLSLVSTAYQAPLNATMSKWIQILSLVSTRKINAEFVYSVKVSKSSKFESIISCNLHPATDTGRADVVARFQYGIKF